METNNNELKPFENWMVKSNVKRIEDGEYSTVRLVETLRANGYPRIAQGVVTARLEYLRGELDGECISYSELAELQSLADADMIPWDDPQLLEAAGVPEEEYNRRNEAQGDAYNEHNTKYTYTPKTS